jgi:hypothetical protein
MSGETYSSLGAACPLCGHVNRPDGPVLYDESTCEFECERCAKPFAVRVYTSTSWTCQPLPQPKDNPHG